MGEFAYASFGHLKDDVLKEISRVVFGHFVDVWSLCTFFKYEYISESSFLERGKKVRGGNFKLSGETRMVSTFDQRCPDILVKQSTQDVAVSRLLPVNFIIMVLGRDIWDSP